MREVHKEYKTFEDIMEDESVSQVKKELLRVILFADEEKIHRAVSLVQSAESCRRSFVRHFQNNFYKLLFFFAKLGQRNLAGLFFLLVGKYTID